MKNQINILLIGGSGKIGNSLKSLGQEDYINLVYPSSSILDLNKVETIERFFKTHKNIKFWDFIIYCSLTNQRYNFIETNINNIENILKFQNHFNGFIHFSSRAVYDGLCSYKEVYPFPLENLPFPENSYSKLKYLEESIIKEYTDKNLYILRLFDTYSYNFKEIKERWIKQLLKNRLDNETLKPIQLSLLTDIIKLIVKNVIEPGIYNICGNLEINSKEYINSIFPNYVFQEKIKFKTGNIDQVILKLL